MTAALADARILVGRAFDAFLPPGRKNVAEYALEHRWLTNEGGGYVGRWTNDAAPYLVGPMECLTSGLYLTTAVAGPAQCAKTTIAENWLLLMVGTAPGAVLWYMQTDDSVEGYVKARINPMIDAHEVMRSARGTRSVDDSLHFKRFRGMTAEFLGYSASTVINKTAPRIIADEYDAYTEALGDPKAILDFRRQTFGSESMLLAISHPDRARGVTPDGWTAGIMALYADSDRRLWYWQCPECGGWSSPAPTAARVMTLEYETTGTLEDVAASARLVCPVAGCRIEDHQRREMNRTGQWIGRGQVIAEDGTVTGELEPHETAGFWILGTMSPFVLGGIGGLARRRVAAERKFELTGEDDDLRTVMVKGWGIPYTPPAALGSIDAETLAERARGEHGLELKVVPEGVRFLTVVSDVQAAHFEWLCVGWGVGGECWVIDRGRLPASPSINQNDWDELYAKVLTRGWPLKGQPGCTMRPRAASWDVQGEPGVTEQAYAAFLRWRKLPGSRVRNYGQIGGRDAWSLLPTQGAGGPNPPRLVVAYPDTVRQASKVAGRGNVPVARFSPNLFKDAIMGMLRKAEAGPGFVHFPKALRSPESPHLWFEQLVSERRDAIGRWTKPHNGVRNETLDLMVMARVIAHLHGLPRINWDKPPSWAAPWDANSMISAGVAAGSLARPDVVPIPPTAPALPAETPRVTVAAARPSGIASRLAH